MKRDKPADFNKALVKIIRREFESGCPHCEYDEAEGGLFNHCDQCCRRITTKLGGLLLKVKP